MSEQAANLAEEARRVTSEILERMGIPAVVTTRDEGESLRVTLHAQDSGLLIGKKGATLDALQLLVTLILQRQFACRQRIVLDAEGYRARRQASLQAAAERLGALALETGETQEMEAMSGYERRIVHLALIDWPGLSTCSEGSGPERRVLIVPTSEPAEARTESSPEDQ